MGFELVKVYLYNRIIILLRTSNNLVVCPQLGGVLLCHGSHGSSSSLPEIQAGIVVEWEK